MDSPDAAVVYALYAEGSEKDYYLPGKEVEVCDFAKLRRTGRARWADAERFLEFLDEASHAAKSFAARSIAATFKNWDEDLESANEPLRPSWDEKKVDQLASVARRIVAIECASFLADADIEHERWLPYKHWQERLMAGLDTVITFNYDRVIETLSEQTGSEKLQVLLPIEAAEMNGQASVPVLKLHGSIDWRDEKKKGVVKTTEPHAFLNSEAPPFIATPGNSKHLASKGRLAHLWRAAVGAIKAASVVNFVGFRFPESDAYARSKLLDALRDSDVQVVNIVLGVESKDAARVKRLLEMARPNARVDVVNLWSQDYLDQWGR